MSITKFVYSFQIVDMLWLITTLLLIHCWYIFIVMKKIVAIINEYYNMRETRKNTGFDMVQQYIYIHRSDELLFFTIEKLGYMVYMYL